MTNAQRRGILRATIALGVVWLGAIGALAGLLAYRLALANEQHATAVRLTAEGLKRPLDDLEQGVAVFAEAYAGSAYTAHQALVLTLQIGIAVPIIVAILTALSFWVWRGHANLAEDGLPGLRLTRM